MKPCPHCYQLIDGRALHRQKMFRRYRECPHCGGWFTVDRRTRHRQALCLFAALVALALTLLMYY